MYNAILIHSPLVGTESLVPLRDALNETSVRACVVALNNEARGADEPYIRFHVECVHRSIRDNRSSAPFVVVGHSGAGSILPVLRSSLPPETKMVFVDASIPIDGNSRFDALPNEAAAQFNASARDGLLGPLWTDDDLMNEIPDPMKRERIVQQLSPMPVGVYEEPIPVPEGSLDGNHLFVLLTEHYRQSFIRAQRLGWTVVERLGRHFDVVNDPHEVARIILWFLGQRSEGQTP